MFFAGVKRRRADQVFLKVNDDKSSSATFTHCQSVKTSAERWEMVGFDAGQRVDQRKLDLATYLPNLALRVDVQSAGAQDRDGVAPVPDRINRRLPLIERFLADAPD